MQNFLILDFGRCTRDPFHLYQQFALLCAQRKVSRVLVRTGAEDADVHYTLHDVLAIVARVLGGPLGIQLALVECSPSIAAVYRAMQPELRSLGCEVRIFGVEREAACWLCGAKDCARTRLMEEAAPV